MALVDIALDLQIVICSFLHPSDILTLRNTCKTLQLVTRKRIVWIDALRRVCVENTLFLPSFPMPDMSDAELEQAAMAPRRWIELSASLSTQRSRAILSPTATRTIDSPFPNNPWDAIVDLVPGGRYVVSSSTSGLGVWDLGYKSSADCKLIAFVEAEAGINCGDVHATPDGMGLVILLILVHCTFYEIYPQSEAPQLTQIARLDFEQPYFGHHYYVSADKMIWYHFHRHEILFTVWDYRLNASVTFAAQVDVDKIENSVEVLATQTAIIVLYEEAILIWAIPPLSPQTPNFYDKDHPQFLPLFTIPFPHGPAVTFEWRTMSSWYIGSSQPLYFDKVYEGGTQVQCFKIVIKPDLSDATLHIIYTLPIAPDVCIPLQSMSQGVSASGDTWTQPFYLPSIWALTALFLAPLYLPFLPDKLEIPNLSFGTPGLSLEGAKERSERELTYSMVQEKVHFKFVATSQEGLIASH
ncbi:hypothetical protein BYT27DRAFT_7245340 [Phlegmacium glaucopus]|nr:hypothetical protein BYT27DRAFT_7245340 [Phlegmacium glaucopus]